MKAQVVLWLFGFSTAAISAFAAGPAYPFPQHVTYAPQTLRPTNYAQGAQDDDVRTFYDYWKANYVVSAGGDPEQFRMAFGKTEPNHSRTVSEGQGYGMVIVAYMAGYDSDAQMVFDGLWRFARAYPSVVDDRLMQWSIPLPPGDTADSAFDGDADIAYALLLADAQWGSAGAIDYHAAALTVMQGILESTIGPQSRLPMLGDWVNPQGSPYNQYTPRTSDFMPAHFRAFCRASGNAAWPQVVTALQSATETLQTTYAKKTGLLPDFAVPQSRRSTKPKPAPPNFLEGPYDGDYNYNACRDPWRLGVDGLLNGDAVSLRQTQAMSLWVEQAAKGEPLKIRAGYKLNGQPLPNSNYFTTAFASPFAVGAMTSPTQQVWLDKLYSAIRTEQLDYYEDSITLQCLLILSGNYWDPTAEP